MFLHLPKKTELPCSPDDLVKVFRSMNMVKISLDDYMSEPSEAYIVTSRAMGGLQTHIVFYLDAPAVRAIFSYESNPYSADQRVNVEAEAADFVEQMGAILEDVGWDGMPSSARSEWLSQQYLFRQGERRERAPAMEPTIGAAIDVPAKAGGAVITPGPASKPAAPSPSFRTPPPPSPLRKPGEPLPPPQDLLGEDRDEKASPELEEGLDELLSSAFMGEGSIKPKPKKSPSAPPIPPLEEIITPIATPILPAPAPVPIPGPGHAAAARATAGGMQPPKAEETSGEEGVNTAAGKEMEAILRALRFLARF